MWVGGDGIMFLLMMIVFLMWATDNRASSHSHGWLEAARRATVAPSATSANADIDEDEDQLAAYNEYLARLNDAEAGHRPG
jgi:putative membrane protein